MISGSIEKKHNTFTQMYVHMDSSEEYSAETPKIVDNIPGITYVDGSCIIKSLQIKMIQKTKKLKMHFTTKLKTEHPNMSIDNAFEIYFRDTPTKIIAINLPLGT